MECSGSEHTADTCIKDYFIAIVFCILILFLLLCFSRWCTATVHFGHTGKMPDGDACGAHWQIFLQVQVRLFSSYLNALHHAACWDKSLAANLWRELALCWSLSLPAFLAEGFQSAVQRIRCNSKASDAAILVFIGTVLSIFHYRLGSHFQTHPAGILETLWGHCSPLLSLLDSS
jgi:hypothetical protein